DEHWHRRRFPERGICSYVPRANQLVRPGDGLTSHTDPFFDSFAHFLSVVAGFIFMIDWARPVVHVAPRERAGEASDGHQSKVHPTHTGTLFRRTLRILSGKPRRDPASVGPTPRPDGGARSVGQPIATSSCPPTRRTGGSNYGHQNAPAGRRQA